MAKKMKKETKKLKENNKPVLQDEPLFRFDRNRGCMIVEFADGSQITIQFDALEFATFLLKVTNEIYCSKNNTEDRYRLDELGNKLEEFHKLLENIDVEWLIAFKRSARFQSSGDSTQDARRALSAARKRIEAEFKKNGIILPENNNLIDRLLPVRNRRITYPLDMIKLEGADPFLEAAKGQLVFREHGVTLSKDDTEIKLIPDGIEGEFKIPETVTKLKGDIFEKCKKITSILIPESVISIDVDVFSGCEELERIEVAEGNPVYKSINGMLFNKEGTEIIRVPEGMKGDIQVPESVTDIGDGAFRDCGGLNSITIPNGVIGIGSDAFSGCTGLTSITIPDCVAGISDGAFEGCTGLTSIIIPEGVRQIGEGAFSDCTGLKSVVIPESVMDIGEEAFYNCTGLTSIIIPESVDEIGESAFSGCERLTSIIIPEGVTEVGELVFSGCTGLKNVVIPEGITRIGQAAFIGCTGLTSITIPEGVTEIRESAFRGCTGLKGVVIPESVTKIGGFGSRHFGDNPFFDCNRLERIEVAEENPVYKSINGMLLNKEGTKLIFVPNGVKGELQISGGVTEIGDEAFSGCAGLERIEVAEENPVYKSINGILLNKEGTELMFVPKGVKGELQIPESVTEIGWDLFSDCNRLERIEVAEENPVYKGINGMLFNKEGTKLILVPNGVKGELQIPESVTEIEWKLFSGCAGLERIEVAEENPVYKSINGIVLNKEGTELIFVPQAVKGELQIPEGVTKIGKRAFYNCTGLTSIIIPEGVTEIGELAFYMCTGLTSIIIPEGVTEIGAWVFCMCTGLTSITIPEGVTKIGKWVFVCCWSLKEIYFEGDAPSLLDSFKDVSATICYRKGTKGWGKAFGGLPTREIDE